VGDPTGHPGTIAGPGVPTVLIAGQPAAVVGDTHTCAMPPLAGPHPPTPIALGSATVLIGGRPAARVGDTSGCGAPIVAGAPTVLIGG
jgi:uncharacterized Zn-binding protein involved in type VI secretion